MSMHICICQLFRHDAELVYSISTEHKVACTFQLALIPDTVEIIKTSKSTVSTSCYSAHASKSFLRSQKLVSQLRYPSRSSKSTLPSIIIHVSQIDSNLRFGHIRQVILLVCYNKQRHPCRVCEQTPSHICPQQCHAYWFILACNRDIKVAAAKEAKQTWKKLVFLSNIT